MTKQTTANHRGETFKVGDRVLLAPSADGASLADTATDDTTTTEPLQVEQLRGGPLVKLDRGLWAESPLHVDWLTHVPAAADRPDLVDGDGDYWIWFPWARNGEGGYLIVSQVDYANRAQHVARIEADRPVHAGRSREYIVSQYDSATPVEPAAKASTRPTVVLPEGKTRDNAGLVEAYLTGEDATLLNQARAGVAVDAQHLDAAVTKALSTIAADVREARRREPLTSAARSILHRTSAVINNHLDALPAYEAGVRSRKIAELEEALETERQSVRDLRRQRSQRNEELTQVRHDLEEAIRQERKSHLAAREAEVATLRAQVERRDARIVSLKRNVSAQAKTLRFLQSHETVGEFATSLVEAFRAGRRSK